MRTRSMGRKKETSRSCCSSGDAHSMGKFCWGGITLGSAGPASIMVDSLFGSGQMAMLLRGVIYRYYKGPFRRLGQSVWVSYRPFSSSFLLGCLPLGSHSFGCGRPDSIGINRDETTLFVTNDMQGRCASDTRSRNRE
jgi:hypothetical protein